MQFIQGDLFADFPDLRLVIPHGGGAVPYHWGRYRGPGRHAEEAAAERARDEERVLRHLRLPPARHRPAVRGDRHRQHPVRLGDGRRGARHRPGDRPLLRRHQALHRRAGLSDGRRTRRSIAATPAACTRAWTRPCAHEDCRGSDCHERHLHAWTPTGSSSPANPRKPDYVPARRRGRRALPRLRPGRRFPYAPERKYTPVDARQGAAVRAARLPRLRPQRHRAGDLPRRGQLARWSTRCARPATGPAAWRRSGPASPTPSSPTCTTPACAACASTSSSAWSTPSRDDYYRGLVDRIAPLGWHIVIYFEAADLAERWDFFTSLPTTVVVDHMGRPDVTKPVDGPEFALVPAPHATSTRTSGPRSAARSGCRSAGPPGYDDVVPFARRIVERFPDRVLWGTDWPHPNMKTHMPDDGHARRLHPAHRAHRGPAAQAAGRQPDAAVLGGLER